MRRIQRIAGDVVPFPDKNQNVNRNDRHQAPDYSPLMDMDEAEAVFELTGKYPDDGEPKNVQPGNNRMGSVYRKKAADMQPPSQFSPVAKIPPAQRTPEQHAAHQNWQGQVKQYTSTWHAANPLNHQHIKDHFNDATPDEVANGMNWYKDAHHIAKTISQKSGLTPNQTAGLIAVYSPQKHWSTNMMEATHSALTGKAVSKEPYLPNGKGNMISGLQQQKAQQIIGGEPWQNVLGGPKIRDFASLIEHGQDDDPSNPRAVIDRHALGVAHGAYADGHVYSSAGLSSKRGYGAHAQAYGQAANELSQETGTPMAAHQLQAITWLVRQRRNAEGGYSNPQDAERQRGNASRATEAWNQYAAQHLPEATGMAPGVGFSNDLIGRHTGSLQRKASTASVPKNAAWSEDKSIRGYRTAQLDAKFACTGCNTTFQPSEFHRCACGKSWASILFHPSGKEAAKTMRIIRPVAEHRERILASRTASATEPFYVRKNQTDSAPTVMEQGVEKRTAAGGWGDTKAPGFAPSSTTPAVKSPTQQAADLAKTQQNVVAPEPTAVTPPVLPKSTTAPKPTTAPKGNRMSYNESDFKHGWSLAAASEPLSRTARYSHSFLEGYEAGTLSALADMGATIPELPSVDQQGQEGVLPQVGVSPTPAVSAPGVRQAERAPGWDTVAPAFEAPTPGLNNGMSDNTDTNKKNLGQETKDVRNDLADKLDSDIAQGQSRSNDSMSDLSGWKSSALIAELQRRVGR